MKNVADFDWDEIRDALSAYVSYLEENEPHAVNSISTFQRAADECPSAEEFE
jgi:hypothetical protein